jgi:hypothetical protein
MRDHQVIVSFGKDIEFKFLFAPADLAPIKREDAREWLQREFVDLECDLPSPVGKVLLLDEILAVAKYAGQRRFHDKLEWASQFAKNSAVLLGRDMIRVDVANNTVGS